MNKLKDWLRYNAIYFVFGFALGLFCLLVQPTTPSGTITLEPLPVEDIDFLPPAPPDPEALVEMIEATPLEAPEIELIDWGEFKVTAYCSCVKCCDIWSAEHPSRLGTDFQQLTSSGTVPVANHTVAADTDVFPYGTQIVIDGRMYTVEDTGGAMQGKTLDIYFDSHELAVEHGVQYKQIFQLKGDY